MRTRAWSRHDAGARPVTDEDLIESPPRPPSAWHGRVAPLLRGPAAGAALLVIGLIAGSVSGYVVGQSDPVTFSGIYRYWDVFGSFTASPFAEPSIDETYGRTPLPSLAAEDLAALGENVSRQFSVLAARSAIPILCAQIRAGPPGTTYPNDQNVQYPSTVFEVDSGTIAQLVRPHFDAAAASGALQTLVSRAEQCPAVPNAAATIVSGGVQSGIGDEYAVFSRTPTVSAPDELFVTVVLVRIGPDLIELSFTSGAVEAPDAEGRCIRTAQAAVQKILGG